MLHRENVHLGHALLRYALEIHEEKKDKIYKDLRELNETTRMMGDSNDRATPIEIAVEGLLDFMGIPLDESYEGITIERDGKKFGVTGMVVLPKRISVPDLKFELNSIDKNSELIVLSAKELKEEIDKSFI